MTQACERVKGYVARCHSADTGPSPLAASTSTAAPSESKADGLAAQFRESGVEAAGPCVGLGDRRAGDEVGRQAGRGEQHGLAVEALALAHAGSTTNTGSSAGWTRRK